MQIILKLILIEHNTIVTGKSVTLKIDTNIAKLNITIRNYKYLHCYCFSYQHCQPERQKCDMQMAYYWTK